MKNPNTFTILIPTWKRPKKLRRALEHVTRQLRIPEEVIVVIRKEDEESKIVLDQFSQLLPLKIAYTTEVGVIAAENSGLKNVTSNFVVFLDDDGYPPIDWLKKIDDFFVKYPDACALGGTDIIYSEPWTYYQNKVSEVGKISWYGKITGNHHRKIIGSLRKVDVLKGVNMTFRRDTFDYLDTNLAGADGNLGNGSQWELDLCLRVKKVGNLYFDPDLIVIHDSDHSTHNHLMAAKNNAHNLAYVMLKNNSFIKNIIFILYSYLIGNTQLPGIVKLLEEFFSIGLKQSLSKYIYKISGFNRGIITYLKCI